jgi:DNA-binding MarR family transcriptional regulator
MSRGRSSTSQDGAGAADRGPLLGALLRLAHQSIVRRILAGLAKAGFDDVQSAHFAPLQALWDHPEGRRLTDLARMAQITKQSMGELVEQLIRRGYLERIQDPDDGRATRIRHTPVGRKLSRKARLIVHRAEAEWARQIGERRIEDLRSALRLLLDRDR